MALGLGIGELLPYAVYGASFFVALLALLYRCEIGIIFLTCLFPVYTLMSKALKSGLPLANNLTDIIIAAMLLGWMMRKSSSQEELLKPSPLLFPIAILFIYTFVSWMSGSSYFGAFGCEINLARLSHWKNYMIMPLLYIIAYYNLRERKWQYIMFMLLSLTFLVSDLKFRQSFKWVKHTVYMEKSRLSGALGSLGPNEMGGFYAIYTLFLMGVFLLDSHIKRRIAYLLLIMGNMYCLVYSFSRGAYAAILVGLFFIAIFRSRMLLIPLIIFLFAWKSFVPPAVVDRIERSIVEEGERSDVVSMGAMQVETAGRTEIWDRALEYFTENLLFGKGYNTYQMLTDWDTHNVYLKFMAEQGLIGLGLFLWLYYLALRSGWQLYRSAEEQIVKGLGFGFLCAVVGSMVANFFGDRWTYVQLGGIYWVLWALVDQYNARIAAGSAAVVAALGPSEIDHPACKRIT